MYEKHIAPRTVGATCVIAVVGLAQKRAGTREGVCFCERLGLSQSALGRLEGVLFGLAPEVVLVRADEAHVAQGFIGRREDASPAARVVAERMQAESGQHVDPCLRFRWLVRCGFFDPERECRTPLTYDVGHAALALLEETAEEVVEVPLVLGERLLEATCGHTLCLGEAEHARECAGVEEHGEAFRGRIDRGEFDSMRQRSLVLDDVDEPVHALPRTQDPAHADDLPRITLDFDDLGRVIRRRLLTHALHEIEELGVSSGDVRPFEKPQRDAGQDSELLLQESIEFSVESRRMSRGHAQPPAVAAMAATRLF